MFKVGDIVKPTHASIASFAAAAAANETPESLKIYYKYRRKHLEAAGAPPFARVEEVSGAVTLNGTCHLVLSSDDATVHENLQRFSPWDARHFKLVEVIDLLGSLSD